MDKGASTTEKRSMNFDYDLDYEYDLDSINGAYLNTPRIYAKDNFIQEIFSHTHTHSAPIAL